jgi:hypothetical protein
LETVPAEVPYLHAEPQRVEGWRKRLEEVQGFRVGVVWQGNPKFQWDRWRSVPLEEFAPLVGVEGVRLVSLQQGDGTEQVRALRGRVPVVELGEELDAEGSFLDPAAVMRCLDVVVTADTAAAHLAGAAEVTAWVALAKVADWRWGRAGESTRWYPSMRLFRQCRLGEWGPVFRCMAGHLCEAAAGPGLGVEQGVEGLRDGAADHAVEVLADLGLIDLDAGQAHGPRLRPCRRACFVRRSRYTAHGSPPVWGMVV